MKTEPEHPIDFKAWRDLDVPPDFTANVMRRIRTAPAVEPGWRSTLAFWLNSRLAYSTAVAASLLIAALVWSSSHGHSAATSLEARSLLAAYAQAAGGS